MKNRENCVKIVIKLNKFCLVNNKIVVNETSGIPVEIRDIEGI